MNKKTINSLRCLKCDREISRILANTFSKQVRIKGDWHPIRLYAEPLCQNCYVELNKKYGGDNG